MQSYFIGVATKHARGSQGQFPFPNLLLKPIYWQLAFYGKGLSHEQSERSNAV